MLNFKNVSFVLCVILIGLYECKPDAPAKKQKTMKINKVEYDLNKDLVTLTVNVREGPEGSLVDLDAELFKEIPNEIYVNVVISKLSGKSEYKPMVKPGKQNMCEFMKHPDKEPILKMLLERLNDFGKMDFSCPVQPGKFWLKGFYIEGSALPSYAPPGQYKVDFAVTKKEKEHILLFKMSWYATITLE